MRSPVIFCLGWLLLAPSLSLAVDPDCVEGERQIADETPTSGARTRPMTLARTQAEAREHQKKVWEQIWKENRERYPFAVGERDAYRDDMIQSLIERGVISRSEQFPKDLSDAELFQWLSKEYVGGLVDRSLEREQRNARLAALREGNVVNAQNRPPQNLDEPGLNAWVNAQYEQAVTAGKIKPIEEQSPLLNQVAAEFKKSRGRDFYDSRDRSIGEVTRLVLSEASSLVGTAYRRDQWARGRDVLARSPRTEDGRHPYEAQLAALDRDAYWSSSQLRRNRGRDLPFAWYETHRAGGIFPQYDVRSEFPPALREAVKHRLIATHGVDSDFIDFLWDRFELDTSGRVGPLLSTADNGSYGFLARPN